MWRDRRLRGALVAILALFGGALALGLVLQVQAWAAYARARTEARQEWLGQGDRNPHDAGHWGTFVFKEPHPLGALERGASDYMGDWVRLETHRQNDPQHRRAKEATGPFRLGVLTPMTVFAMVLPLVILVWTHAAVCGEEIDGTAALVRSMGVPPVTVMTGKVLAALLLIGGSVFAMLAAAGGAVWFAGARDGPTAVAFLALAVVVLVHTVVFVLLGVLVSTLARTPRHALAAVVPLWVVACVLTPRLAASVAEAAAPAPSAFEFREALERHRDNKWSVAYRARGNFMEIYGEIERRLMEEQGVATADALTVDPFGLAIEETEEEGQRAYEASFRVVLERFARQDAWQRWLAVWTPQSALRRMAATLSETDLTSHLRFVDAAEQYRRGMMRTLNLDIAYHGMEARRAAGGTSYIREHRRDETFWHTFPEFTLPSRPVAAALQAAAPEMAVLLTWVLLGSLGTRWAIRRRWG